MKRFASIVAAGGVALGAAGALGARAATTNTPGAGIIHVYLAGSLGASSQAIVITGAFGDAGRFTEAAPKSKVVLSKGSLTVDDSKGATRESDLFAHLSSIVNPTTGIRDTQGRYRRLPRHHRRSPGQHNRRRSIPSPCQRKVQPGQQRHADRLRLASTRLRPRLLQIGRRGQRAVCAGRTAIVRDRGRLAAALRKATLPAPARSGRSERSHVVEGERSRLKRYLTTRENARFTCK
jgi:hypothetical protein